MNIGLVLSGGMAKGAFQVGALKALSEFIPAGEIKYISCASVGVLNGYAYATGKIDVAEQIWHGLCDEGEHFSIGKVLKGDLVQRVIEGIYSEEDEVEGKFFASLLDMKNKAVVYKDIASLQEGTVDEFLKASVSLPVYSKAVELDSNQYYDGAMVDNIPVFPLLEYDLDYIVCIYFDESSFKFESTLIDDKIIKITFPGDTVIRQSVIFDKDSLDGMIEEGYNRTVEILSSVFARGYDDLGHIYNCIAYSNSRFSERKFRVTGDVVVTNINRVTEKFNKRRIERRDGERSFSVLRPDYDNEYNCRMKKFIEVSTAFLKLERAAWLISAILFLAGALISFVYASVTVVASLVSGILSPEFYEFLTEDYGLYIASGMTIAVFFWCVFLVLVSVVLVALSLFEFRQASKVKKCVDNINSEIGKTADRVNSVGVLVFGLFVNFVAFVFYIINFIRFKKYLTDVQNIKNLQSSGVVFD